MSEVWYKRSLSEVTSNLEVDHLRGLSQRAVAERRRRYGKNSLPEGKKLHWWQMLLGQFTSPLVIILLIAAGLTFYLKEYVDTYVILLAVFVNIIIGFWQEFRSNQIFEKLHQLVQVTARVRRDGETMEVDMKELVPGDIVLLRADMKVPADARVLSARDLKANEAVLTGESKSVRKEPQEITDEVSVGDRANMVHMGTIIERGEGEAVVVSTDGDTEIGKIAALAAGVQDESTPLQEKMARLGKRIAILITSLTVLIVVVGVAEAVLAGEFSGEGVAEIFTVAVAVAVAAIPEGLPAALSVVLAVAASRVLRRKGLIKKLLGAETLGSTSVIVTDKTGTLTTGKMEVEKIIDTEDEERASLALALSSDVMVVRGGDGKEKLRGEATDKAKVEYFLKRGGSFEEAHAAYGHCALLPFNQEKKYIASFHIKNSGAGHIFVTGAPEILLELSTLNEARKEEIRTHIEENARHGYRMIGIAERSVERAEELHCEDNDSLEQYIKDVTFLGVAALRDPVREDVREAVTVTRRANVRVIMATGDHRLTAASIGEELGFCTDPECIVEGKELGLMDDAELARRVEHAEIFTRVSPEHKLRVTKILRDRGEVVAMTGDGVNDAPALKTADIGISLESGTDITKEAADLVLIDNSFSVITEAIRQGRAAFENIRKVTVFLMHNAFTEITLILAALLFQTRILPLTAVLILWSNLIENALPTFALAFEKGEPDIMERDPVDRRESIIDKEGWAIILSIVFIANLVVVGIFFYLLSQADFTDEHIQTLIFSFAGVNMLFIVFALKSYRAPLFRTRIFDNPYLWLAVIVGTTLLLSAIYVPVLQKLLGTVPLSAVEMMLVFLFGFFQLGMVEVVKWVFRRNIFEGKSSPRAVSRNVRARRIS